MKNKKHEVTSDLRLNPLQKLKDEICRLHRFGHGSEADAVFEATLKAFSLDRDQLNKEILGELLKLEGIRKGKKL